MIMIINYVLPNTSEMNRRGRGSLRLRQLLAEQVGCDLVEMPADFIKNKTECDLTGLPLCSFLDQQAIQLLYQAPNESNEIAYILHTEPSLPRTDGYGLSSQAPLRWYDQDWVERFIEMMIALSKHLKAPAYAVEIHPGDSRNVLDDLIRACKELRSRYSLALGQAPLILIENRTGQFISTGTQIAEFWAILLREPGLAQAFGIVLDIQQLFTSTGRDFIREFEMIPLKSIKGLHVHTRHRIPSVRDNIPWDIVFDRIQDSNDPLLLNPEIHHSSAVSDAIMFCRERLKQSGPQ